ncbi:MAG: hypothetical protein KIS80_02010 [Anaerolineales bacterium]|nr:hypothetical protein [Anaerolineales bacterium]
MSAAITSFLKTMMHSSVNPRGRRLGEIFLPAFVLWVLFVFTYARFYSIPYLGFEYRGVSGEITEVHLPEMGLEVGDEIMAVNGRAWSQATSRVGLHLLALSQPGDVLLLDVRQGESVSSVTWQVAGATPSEFSSRFFNTWWVSYVFWLAGTVSLVLLRPKDKRWALLVGFNYVTAIWFMAGTLSRFGVLLSPLILRMGIWLSLPIYLHLHWVLPREIRRLPRFVWFALYGLSILAALGYLFGYTPYDSYLSAFLVAVLGSVALLTYRFFLCQAERKEIGLILFGAGVAFLPAAVVALTSLQPDASATLPGYVISMMALPGAYLYIAMRRRLGDLEVRANRAISLYLFLVLMVTFSLLLLPITTLLFPGLAGAGGVVVVTAVVASLFSILGFSGFQKFVERKILGIPETPQRLLEEFAGRLSTSFSHSNLAALLTTEVLPALFIRQSALLNFDVRSTGRVVYLQGVKADSLPNQAQQKVLASLPANALIEQGYFGRAQQWAKVSLPLVVAGEPRGLWLLGRKDPDDHYSEAELRLLRSLANQMAIALVNIGQASDLRSLYQANVQRQEAERIHLARELHDDTLGQVGDLVRQVAGSQAGTELAPKLEGLVGQIRRMINGLRPPLLDQGLYFALVEQTEQLARRADRKLNVRLAVPLSLDRFDPEIEVHIFRIVQQAADNALKYSRARHLVIEGKIDALGVDLTVSDDGIGFRLTDSAGLDEFLGKGHFGLAGMQERAAMMGAKLSVITAPKKGTRVHLAWRRPA